MKISIGHRDAPWFSKALEAHNKGMDHVFMYGINYLKSYHEKFHSGNFHLIPPYNQKYIPNPFRFQYDLTVHIWINYYKILKAEVEWLRAKARIEKNADYMDAADEMLASKTLYGITRADFLFAAAELRWPTTILPDGSHHGMFIRDPWSEKRVAALSHEQLKYVISFGGGGQGKTHVSLCVLLMIFDHFLFTNRGARCMISTVNKDKMNSVSWSYLLRLNSTTDKGISLYAGKAKPGGEWTLRRPNNKDVAGVFKGVLIGNNLNSQTIVDKLTGSHGHPFIGYIIDEIQSTPSAPIDAAPNYTMHAGDFRIIGAGNFGENNDTLANNIKPDIGWNSVDENTGEWVSTMTNGSKAIVLHFNNNNSPGMTDGGHKKFPHLPSKKKLDQNFPDQAKRNENNTAYRRFWIGWRASESDDRTVINERIVRENMADLPLQLDVITHTFFNFDSAQAERDRNIMTICREGVDTQTKLRVFGPSRIHLLEKATESLKYYEESSNQILEIARKNNIISGGGTVDWTGRPAHAERLASKGFHVHKLVYNKAVPDGKRRDSHTNRIEREIRLNIALDFKDDIPPERVCAHHVSENVISLGAWALREYVKAGRVRGLNEALITKLTSPRSLEEELYMRKFRFKNSATHGSRFHLESKDDFKIQYGFSPDILDTLFQAAWYMLIVRKLPLTPIGEDAILQKQSNQSQTSFHEESSEMWEEDGVFEV